MFHVEPSSADMPGSPPANCVICGTTSIQPLFVTRDYFLTGETFGIVACSGCGVLFTWPRPAANDLTRYYQSDEYVSHSNTRRGLVNTLYQLIRVLALKSKYRIINRYTRGRGRLLDIGCGTGHFLDVFKREGWDVQGIEPGEAARDFARTTFSLDVRPEVDLETLESGSFDVITMWHVLEHVPDPEQRLREVHRLLKNDGVAFIALPNKEAWDAEKYGKYWAAWDVPRHLFHFDPISFGYLMEKSGFFNVDTLPMRLDAFYVAMLSEKYLHGRNRYLRAFLNGLKSNNIAAKSGNFSSMIYVLRKSR
jgi:SAM-dependent methyltransferase